jgi:AcrR family transcriptional regulator
MPGGAPPPAGTGAAEAPEHGEVSEMSPTGSAAGTAGTAAPQRRMRADARRNSDLLLASAAEAFAERGSDEVSLEEIARRAGVGIGTLYRHFPTRQSLLEAVYRDQVEALGRLAEELLPSPDPASALTQWLAALVQFGSTKRSMSASLLATVNRDSELFSTCTAIMRGSMTSLLERAQQAGAVRPDVVAADLQRLTHALVISCETAPADPAQAARLLTMVMGGVLTSPPSPPGDPE